MKLEAQNITAGYGASPVLKAVDLTVPDGSFTVLLGPNGSGKSTLFKVLAGLLKPSGGVVRIDGTDIRKIPRRMLAKKLAVLSQFHSAPSTLSVAELVRMGRFPHRGVGGFLSAHDRAVADGALEAMELLPLKNRKIGELSGGERQRAWIAMTIAQEPETLLLDEPATFLDICCQLETIELLTKLNREYGVTIAAVLHSLDSAARCADRIAMLKEGKIRYSGTPSELLRPPVLLEVFDIETEVITMRDGTLRCLPMRSAKQRTTS